MPIKPPFSLVPLVGAVAIVLVCVLAGRRAKAEDEPLPRSTFGWEAVYILALALAGIYATLGNVSGNPLLMVSLTGIGVAFSLVTLLRQRFMDWLARRGKLVQTLVRAALLALGALLCAAALEATYNWKYLDIAPYYFFLQWLIVFGVVATLYFLGQRHGVADLLAVFAAYGIGLAQFFVYKFKGTAILPGDVLAIGTAAAVSGNYTYSVTQTALVGMSYALAAVGVFSLLRGPRAAASPVGAHASAAKRKPLLRTAITNVSVAVICGALTAGFLTIPSYSLDLGVNMAEWWAYDYYCRQGFLPCFVLECQKLPIPVPEGYSAQRAQELEDQYAAKYDASATDARSEAEQQFQQVKPTIIVVMNESFSDVSTYENMPIPYDGPTFFKSGVPDSLATGRLAVSVTGGGTCNTEFEFLTGNSMAFVGPNKYPYNIYQFDKTDNIVRQLGGLGYKTTAIHPNLATNWSRNRVYPQLGFDQFLSYDDFKDAPTFHYPKYGVTDKATYDKILDLLANDSNPQFIFDVTMQNHSGYDKGTIPDNLLHHFHVPGLSSYVNSELDEYVACIDKSDEALEYFIGKLRELDRPVVLVFFGDHQSIISPDVNDTFYPNEDPFVHRARLYETVYMTWANYDVAGADQTSQEQLGCSSTLGEVLLETIGAPLTNKQKADLAGRQTLPAFTPYSLYDADGGIEEVDSTSEAGQTYRDLAMIDYLEYGSKQ